MDKPSMRKSPTLRERIAPALTLFFVAPLVAEFLLGNLPIKLLPALVMLAPLYGGGALLIRESVKRTGRGWPSILILGIAYAILEEAFTTQSLFNPDYLSLNLRLLQPAYIPFLKIGGWWTFWMFNVHAVWSIATPIALVEGLFPNRADSPWLGKVGLIVVSVLFAFGLIFSTVIGYRHDHFVASRTQFAVAAFVTFLLIVLAFRLPVRSATLTAEMNASFWLAGLMALAAGSIALILPKDWGWGAVAVLLALDLFMVFIVVLWPQQKWTKLQVLALAAGAALAYAWHSFFQTPAVNPGGMSVRVGNGIFTLGAILLIALGAKRSMASAR